MIDKRDGDEQITRELETADPMFMVRRCLTCTEEKCNNCYKTHSPKTIEKELTTA